MSPRAAWRLEALGFPDVAHYAGGVADWMASGLAIEGTMARDLQLKDVADPKVPTCSPQDTVADIRRYFEGSDWPVCFVVNEHRIVLGRIQASDLHEADPAAHAEDVMRPGPVTYRPDFQADRLVDVMEQRDLHVLPVTTSEGVLVGAVRRDDLKRALAGRTGGRAALT